jgi:hypothetical protein
MSKLPQSDAAFFAERAKHERAAAEIAGSRDARWQHLDAAAAFENLSSALTRAHSPTLKPRRRLK